MRIFVPHLVRHRLGEERYRRVFGQRVWLDPLEVLDHQYVGLKCRRMDIILRLCAADQSDRSDPGGAALYTRYRALRQAPDKSPEIFAKLKDSMRRTGYDAEKPVIVTSNWSIEDGAHRLACAIVLGLPQIAALMLPATRGFYSVPIEWFTVNGFSRDEVATLERAERTYRKRILSAKSCSLPRTGSSPDISTYDTPEPQRPFQHPNDDHRSTL